MAATCRLPLSEVDTYTLRTLFLYWQQTVLDQWDHTSILAMYLQNILCGVAGFGKTKIKPLSLGDIHPYRKGTETKTGVKITGKNLKTLRVLAKSLSK